MSPFPWTQFFRSCSIVSPFPWTQELLHCESLPWAPFFRNSPTVGPQWGAKFCQQTCLSFHFQQLPTEASTVTLLLPKPAPAIPRHRGTNVPGTGARWPSSPWGHRALAVGCAKAAGSLAEPSSCTLCSPPEHSTILASHKGRQSQISSLFLIFSIFSLWLFPFLVLPSGNVTVPGSCYKGWVMEKFHHLSPDCWTYAQSFCCQHQTHTVMIIT